MKKSILLIATMLVMSFSLPAASKKNPFQALGSKISEAGDTINTKVTASAVKKIAGTWTFSNGKMKTIIIVNEDETMIIRQLNKSKATEYVGVCTDATSSELTFETTGGTEKWTISYKKLEDTELKVVSSDIPNDANGYEFSNPTISRNPLKNKLFQGATEPWTFVIQQEKSRSSA